MSEDTEFYDNLDVRTNYLAHRDRADNPNDTLERPIFLELSGNLSNLDIVDLGCGDAAFGQAALQAGARSYRTHLTSLRQWLTLSAKRWQILQERSIAKA